MFKIVTALGPKGGSVGTNQGTSGGIKKKERLYSITNNFSDMGSNPYAELQN